MRKTVCHFMPALIIFALFTASCSKEPVVGKIEATIEGYTATFSVDVKNVDSYLWNFGDNKTSTEAAPVHEYLSSGNYTVSLVVSGNGGESSATAQITINPSLSEMLSGGPADADGKTWVLSSVYTEGKEGGGAVDNALSIMLPSMEDMLTEIGLAEEYDNEYTFYSDGRYKVDVKNGVALATGLYGTFTGSTVSTGNENNNLGLCGATYTPPASATWTLHEEDLIVDAITNPLGMDVPAPHELKTFTGWKWVSLSEGAFFGILDFPTTRQFIIKEITPDKINLALFICGYVADPTAWSIPEYLFHVTYVVKK